MNVIDDFRQAIEAADLTPPDEIIADGKIHRFASNGDREDDAGWYVLYGDGIPAGAFGCWRLCVKQTWCGKSDRTMNETERADYRRRIDAASRQRDHEEQRRHAEAAERARSICGGATLATADHPYLQRKQVQPHEIGVDHENRLVVPVVIGDVIASVQFIAPDGTKKFLPGGAVTGGYFLIGDPTDAAILAVGEGFATCASVHEATGYPTVCAFSAGNLLSVSTQLRQQFPTANIVIAGDNDLNGTGQRAARKAAEAIGGLLAICASPPEFVGGTCDFNDVHVQCGLDAVRNVIEAALNQEETTTTDDATPPGPSAEGAPSEATTAEPDLPTPFQLVTAPDSFITKYIHYAAMRTDAPLEAHEALGFGILSALAGPSVTLPIATAVKGWRLTLWLLYLVNSTVGRKSTTLDLAVDVVRAVLGETALIHWEGSPQGLLQRLQARDGQASVFVRDEYSGLMAGMNRGGHLAGLPQLLIKGFDGSVLENVRTRKRGPDGDAHSDTDRVECPYLVQFAAAPWDAFTERATIDNVLDGFLARFVIVMGSASERGLPMITEAIQAAGAGVYDQAQRYHRRAQTISADQIAIEPAVLARQWALEQDYRGRAEASARPDAAGPSLKRLAETALKLSALLALEEDTGTILSIREAHFLIAAQITDKWAGNALRLVEALGRTTFQRDCEQVLRTIRQHPSGVSKSVLYRVHQRLRQRDFEEILSALDAQDRTTIEKAETTGRGRPALIVRAIKGAD